MQGWHSLVMALRVSISFKSVHVAAALDLMKLRRKEHPSSRNFQCEYYKTVLMELATQELEELVLPLFLDPIVVYKVALFCSVLISQPWCCAFQFSHHRCTRPTQGKSLQRRMTSLKELWRLCRFWNLILCRRTLGMVSPTLISAGQKSRPIKMLMLLCMTVSTNEDGTTLLPVS